MKNAFIFWVIAITLSQNVALANDEVEDRKITYNKKTEIDFEDLDVKGTIIKPQSALVLERKQAQFNPLINFRTDWKEEINESVNEVK